MIAVQIGAVVVAPHTMPAHARSIHAGPADADRHASLLERGDLIGLSLRDLAGLDELREQPRVHCGVDRRLGLGRLVGADQVVDRRSLVGGDHTHLLQSLHLLLLMRGALNVLRLLLIARRAERRHAQADGDAGLDECGHLIGLSLGDRALLDQCVELRGHHRGAQLLHRAHQITARDLGLDRGGLIGGEHAGLLQLVEALAKPIALDRLERAVDLRLRHTELLCEVLLELLMLCVVVMSRHGLGEDGRGDRTEADHRGSTTDDRDLLVAIEARTTGGRGVRVAAVLRAGRLPRIEVVVVGH